MSAHVKSVEIDGQPYVVKPLMTAGGSNFYMLHDSNMLLKHMFLQNAVAAHDYIVANYSWFMNDSKRNQIDIVKSLIESMTSYSYDFFESHCVFLMNSVSEYESFKKRFPILNCKLVNNCFSISDDLFHVQSVKNISCGR